MPRHEGSPYKMPDGEKVSEGNPKLTIRLEEPLLSYVREYPGGLRAIILNRYKLDARKKK